MFDLEYPLIPERIDEQKNIKNLPIFHKFQVLVTSIDFYQFSLIKVLTKKQEITSIVFFKLLFIQLCFSNNGGIYFEIVFSMLTIKKV